MEGTAEVGKADVGNDQVGGGCPDLFQIYCAVVQSVLLYRSETWVIMPLIGGIGLIPLKGGPQADREAPLEREGRSVDM